MKLSSTLSVAILVACSFLLAATATEPNQEATTDKIKPATSTAEAQSRAKLLHELVRGTLQVMHRDFFDEDNAHAIPSASMEDVFIEMQRSYDVQLKWLVVNTDVVNVDHQPSDAFEHDAVAGLAAGKSFVEATQENRYRYAGPIRLHSQCLKCHVKTRTNTRPRTAGLLISMPLED